MTLSQAYEIFGLSIGSSSDEVKKHWKKLIFMYHPDRNNGNDKKFKEINKAYNIICSYNDTKLNSINEFIEEWINGILDDI